jgi:hypothetical protein
MRQENQCHIGFRGSKTDMPMRKVVNIYHFHKLLYKCFEESYREW